ncbi:MAG: hypothetical protein HRU41_11715 [Saprospiraceae bacterium]|nr:hypothetical protein [Saprospiraceae bacterium]
MKFKFSLDRILGFAALLISLLTLFIFFYQTNLLKKQSWLSVRPRLTFSKNISRTVSASDSITSTIIELRVSIMNNGLGPAIIESNQVVYQNQKYDMISFFDTALPKLKTYGHFSLVSDLSVGGAIPASESIDLFTYQYDLKNEDQINKYLGVEESYQLPFDIYVEYSSMYEEKWMVTSNKKGHPKQVR